MFYPLESAGVYPIYHLNVLRMYIYIYVYMYNMINGRRAFMLNVTRGNSHILKVLKRPTTIYYTARTYVTETTCVIIFR